MIASIGKIASPAQGEGCFEKDGCYARDDGAHREPSTWAGMPITRLRPAPGRRALTLVGRERMYLP